MRRFLFRLARLISSHFLVVLSLPALVALLFLAACGSGGGMSKTPPFSGNTNVTVMLTSTANDQLSEFDLGFLGITLTSESGKTVTLLSAPSGSGPGAEFMHINGTAEPLVTASIPQDVYTAATVTLNGGIFVCVDLYPTGPDGQGDLATGTFDQLGMPASDVTVAMPSPITVTGASMGLSLDLQVAQSATYSSCYNPTGTYTFSITPSFTLTPLTLSSSPTSSANGMVTGLDGEIAALGAQGNTLTLTLPDPEGLRTVSVTPNGNTVYQGISNFSALAVGMFVDMDGSVQSDGSLLATRIAVEDTSAADVVRGPLMEVTPSTSIVDMHAREQQGKDIPGYIVGFGPFNFGAAAFQISGQLTNLGTLPFVPSFSASNMVPGQEVYISAAAIPTSGYPMATTMTLMPQTIDGTVTASTQIGNFTDYTVTLASYDLFPMLAVLPGQTTVENNPDQVEVYVDSNTQLLNTQPLATGSTLRFYGLVFNDNGTLSMDCAQVNDGVAFNPTSNANARLGIGQAQTTRRVSLAGQQQIVTTITRSH